MIDDLNDAPRDRPSAAGDVEATTDNSMLAAEDAAFSKFLEGANEQERASNAALYERVARAARRGRPKFEALLLHEEVLHEAKLLVGAAPTTTFAQTLKQFENWDARDVLADAVGIPRETFAELTRNDLTVFDVQPVLVVRLGYLLGFAWDAFLKLVDAQFQTDAARTGASGSPLPAEVLAQLRELWTQVEVNEQVHDELGLVDDPHER